MEKNTFLNLDDLYSNHIKRDRNKLRFYEDIYMKCIAKVKKTNKELQKFDCCYQVPAFVFGGPIYDYEELKKYLIFKLKNNGLLAECIDNNTIYISWKPEDINRQKYEKSLENMKRQIDARYNISETKVNEKTIKHKKNGKDNVTAETTQVGVLQYNDEIKDLIPINPKKINKYRPLDSYPMLPRTDMTTYIRHK